MIIHRDVISIYENSTIKNAMEALNKTGSRIVFVVDEQKILIATITDGDIRRGILKGLDLSSSISNIMNTNPIFARFGTKSEEIQKLLRGLGIFALPIVDENKRILGVEILQELSVTQKTDVPVVIMAGGFGKRLGELTKNTPKPMLNIGSKPIMEHIIDRLVINGFRKFYISTFYQSQKIKEYFKDGHEKSIQIEYLEEPIPLGTGGALHFLKDKIDTLFIVVNGDLVIDFNINLLVNFHCDHDAIATMCIREENFQIPYGVVELENMSVKEITEKPSHVVQTNAGIYCFSKKVLSYLDTMQYMDMPFFINNLINSNEKVVAFPLYEYWADLGLPESLEKAKREHTNND